MNVETLKPMGTTYFRDIYMIGQANVTSDQLFSDFPLVDMDVMQSLIEGVF